MSDNPVDDVTPPVVEEVTEPKPPGEPVAPKIEGDNRPPWVDEVLEAITAIPDAIASAAPNPVAPEETHGEDGPQMPGDGDVITDESPVTKPWTHKRLFG